MRTRTHTRFIDAMTQRRVRSWILGCVTLLALLSQACGKRDCPKTPAQVEEKTLERVEDLLDDGEVDGDPRSQVMVIAKGLMPGMHSQRAAQKKRMDTLTAELMTGKPEPTRVEAEAAAVMDSMRVFAHELIDAMVQVHAILQPDQRAGILERFEKPYEPFEPGLMMNAGLKLTLMEYDATDAQETLIYNEIGELVALANVVMKQHHEKKMALVDIFRADRMDAKGAHRLVDEDFALWGTMVKAVTGTAVTVFSAMTPEQLKKLGDQRAEREARCR